MRSIFSNAAITLFSLCSLTLAADRIGPGVPDFWVRPGYKVTVAAQNFGREGAIHRDG